MNFILICVFCRWECPDAPNVTANIVCTACGGAGHIAKDCKNPRPGGASFNLGADGGMDDEVNYIRKAIRFLKIAFHY